VFAICLTQDLDWRKGLGLSGSSSVPLPPQKKRQLGLLAGMLVGILLVVLVGAALIVILALMAPQTPSGNAIDPSSAAIITDITTTSSVVNPVTAVPGPLTQNFKTNSTVYVVFHLNLKNFDFKTHNAAYIQAKFYGDKTYIDQRMLIFTQQAAAGFFEVQYSQPREGNVELYWCLKSDCSDGKLAQTASFTVVA
jgi:hypothetical protein